MTALTALFRTLRRRRKRTNYAFPDTVAKLSGTNMTDAMLNGADLRGVDLTQTIGLKAEQLQGALVDGRTRLPADLASQ